jgi:hypothetical protein
VNVVQELLDKANSLLGLTAKACTQTELTDPQTSDTTVREDDTHIYQPVGGSGWFGYVHVDAAKPAPYQLDNKSALWKHILISGFALIFTGTLYGTLSI